MIYNVMKHNASKYATTRLSLVVGRVDAETGKVDRDANSITIQHLNEARKPRSNDVVIVQDASDDLSDLDSIVAKYN